MPSKQQSPVLKFIGVRVCEKLLTVASPQRYMSNQDCRPLLLTHQDMSPRSSPRVYLKKKQQQKKHFYFLLTSK